MKTIKELENNLNEKESMFFKELKTLFRENDDLKFRPEFYYLILENKEILEEIYPLIDFSYDDYSLYNFHLQFELNINSYKDMYVNDYGIIHIDVDDPHSVFELIIQEIEDINRGELCKCKPGDKDYNLQYKCCGFICESVIPKIVLRKTLTTGFNEWKFFQKDIWNVEKEWENIVTEKEVEQKNKRKLEKENQIKEYERNIQYFERLKQELLNNVDN